MKKWMIAVAGASMLYVGCGDDNSSSSSDEQSQSFKVSSAYELGSCNAYNDRQSVFVEDENAYYVCNNREWKILVENNFDGDENQEHSSESKSSSSEDLTASLCKNCEYGSLTDNRDGQIYRTVKIGEQWWMAENLNYAYTQRTAELDSSSTCIENSPEYCEKYGRFYLISAAMDSVGLFSEDAFGCGDGGTCPTEGSIRGVCPSGWHLPSETEWSVLYDFVGGVIGEEYEGVWGNDWKNVAKKLVSTSLNQYGFDAFPLGALTLCHGRDSRDDLTCNIAIASGSYYKKLDDEYATARFWCSSHATLRGNGYDKERFCGANMRPFDDHSSIGGEDTDVLRPVRCIKD
ncbi:MAG: hypothetical protein MJY47_05365 [Fibrobacter sp.]|nr:hypothetical protein [Fibrobacter sp.]